MGRWAGAFGVAIALAAPSSAKGNLGDSVAANEVRRDAEQGEAGEGERGAELPPPSPELFPRLELARAAGWLPPPEPEPDDREERAEADLDAYFDDVLHRDRLDAGQVDGWYHETGRALRQRFRPDRQAVERERHAGMTVLQVLWDELRRHAGARDRPMDVPGQTPSHLRGAVTDPTDRRQVVEQEAFDWCNALNAPVTWYRVELRITHNPEGELAAVWVLRSSGIRVLDEAALVAARSVELTAPPDRVVGDTQAIQSDWAFELGDVATPIGCMEPSGATTSVMCVDDPVHGGMCAIAGRGIVRTSVTLLRVVDAQHESPAVRRARRRADADRPRP